jgi:hypothetical protein
MPTSKRRKPKDSSEDSPILKHDRIRELLKTMLQTWPQKELFADEIGHWERDLEVFPIVAIEQAFDSWRRNGRWFPVYGDIIDLCIAYQPEPTYKPGCSKACLARHGKGYSEVDVKKLYELYVERKDNAVTRPMTDREIEALLRDLDKWRGKVPEWRA